MQTCLLIFAWLFVLGIGELCVRMSVNADVRDLRTYTYYLLLRKERPHPSLARSYWLMHPSFIHTLISPLWPANPLLWSVSRTVVHSLPLPWPQCLTPWSVDLCVWTLFLSLYIYEYISYSFILFKCLTFFCLFFNIYFFHFTFLIFNLNR